MRRAIALGRGCYLALALTASVVLSFVVAIHPAHAQSTTATSITSPVNPTNVGQSAIFAAAIASSIASAPTGTVTFNDGVTSLGSATVQVGQAVAAGARFTCALSSGGGVKCWGDNQYGELGTTTNNGVLLNNTNPTPADIPSLTGGQIVALAPGGSSTCALTSAGGVKCWGNNSSGQLGTATNSGTSNANPTPSDVTGLSSGVVAVASGSSHACALTVVGGIKCWGNNAGGQLGTTTNNSTGNPNPVPTDVTGLTSGVAAIAAGGGFTCALTSGGGVKCWGTNKYGQLGKSTNNNTNNPNPIPSDVTGLTSGVVAIAAGVNHACALTSAGGVKCWGDNEVGELGKTANAATPNPNPTPNDVTGLTSGVTAITAGAFHTCALTNAGGIKCWGNNGFGRLGTGTSTGQINPAPLDVSGLTSGVSAITAGEAHTCALTSAASIKCWGWNFSGQLGTTTNSGTQNENLSPLDVTNFGSGTVLTYGNASFSTSALSAGDHSITAVYGGDAGHGASTSDALIQSVTKLDQTVSFNSSAPVGAQFGGSYNPSAIATSGLTATLGAGGACSYSGGTVSFDSAGTCTVTADQSGDATYNPAPQATQVFAIGKADQTVNFTSTAPATAKFGESYNPTATATSGLAAAFGASGACSYSGGVVSFISVGACTVTADQGGNSNYNAASQKTQSITVIKADQTVSFTSPTPAHPKVGDTYTPAATATSGLVPTFGTSGACAFVAGKVTFNAAGACTVTADQLGNADYNAASQVTQPIIVSKAETTLTVSGAPATAKPGQAITLTARVTVPAGVSPGGSVTFKEGNKPLGSGAVSAKKASASVSGLTIGNHVITAQYGGDSNLTQSSATTTVNVVAAVGTETQVNTMTAGTQQAPAVAALRSGHVVVWQSDGQDGAGCGVYGQRFTTAGPKTGAELHISTATAGNQMLPKVAGLTSGGFVVVWQSQNQDGSGYGIYGQRFSAAGVTSGAEFKVNSTTAGDQTLPAVAATIDGGFVVAWTSSGQDGSGLGIYAQRYDNKGKLAGAEFKVNKTTAGDQSNPAVAALTAGGFVITWQGPDASGLGIYAQRYDGSGNAVGNQLAVNRTTINDQTLPAIAALATGGFVIAWQSTDASGLGVYARRYDSQARPIGGDVLVNTTTVNDQGTPSVAAFTDGGYVIAWTSNLQDGSGQGVYAQAYAGDGGRVNVELLVNTVTADDQSQPAAAAFASGNFVVVWTSASDGSGQGIFSQRFLVPGTN